MYGGTEKGGEVNIIHTSLMQHRIWSAQVLVNTNTIAHIIKATQTTG